MKLVHYSAEPLVFDQREYRGGIDLNKPDGLWVSVQGEYDWPSWCTKEGFRLRALRYQAVVTPKAWDRILIVDNSASLHLLQRRFPPGVHPERSHWFDARPSWDVVAESYSGIVIAPYQGSCRMSGDTQWYYGWDCASGCIWDTNDIKVSESVLSEYAYQTESTPPWEK